MTEKRFREIVSVETIVDDVTGKRYIGLVDSAFIDLVNELHEENEQLRHDASVLIQSNQDYRKENEQLKKQLTSIDRLIDNKIDEFKNGDYGDLPCNTIHMFLDLKQEIEDLE